MGGRNDYFSFQQKRQKNIGKTMWVGVPRPFMPRPIQPALLLTGATAPLKTLLRACFWVGFRLLTHASNTWPFP